MKRFLKVLAGLLCALVAAFGCIGCGSAKSSEPVAITVTETVAEGTTLLDVMNEMKADGELRFKISNGMVTEINGVKNDVDFDPCWMLYTTDTDSDCSSAEWGTYEYNGTILNSAILGAESLPVKTGETYVWVYQTF